MVMRSGESWHCTNSSCNSSILVQTGSPVDGGNPRCACGAPLKKVYKPPVFSYLDFLRLEDRELVELTPKNRPKE